MVYYLVTAFYIVVCLLLLMVVLLQQGKGGDIASAFGGGSSQTAFGARGGATLLSKITAGLAVLFMLSALGLAIMGTRGSGSSIMRGTPAPREIATPAPEPTPDPVPAPGTPNTTEPKPEQK